MAGKKGTDLPFKGKAEGTSTAATPTDAPVGALAAFTTTSSGDFIGSHLGKGTYTGSSTQTWFLADAGQCADSVYGAVSGDITLTAANGDTVTATAQEGSIVCEVGNDRTTYDSTIIYEIDGGTGKFETATGSFTSTSSHVRPLPPPVRGSDDVGSWEGTISYNN